MNNKKLITTICIFAGVLLVAGVLYSRLTRDMQPQSLVTITTETATEAAAESIQETTQATQPETIAAVDFTVKDFDGNAVKLSDYFGKPIVLNFWAYWCGPCQSEMPEFNARYEELGGEVTFLMVHADPDTAKGKDLVENSGYTFPVVFDETYQAAATYGISAYPTTFFIDAEGNLQTYYVGAMSEELLQMGIDRIYTTND